MSQNGTLFGKKVSLLLHTGFMLFFFCESHEEGDECRLPTSSSTSAPVLAALGPDMCKWPCLSFPVW